MTPLNQKFLVLSTYVWNAKTHQVIPTNATHMIFNSVELVNTHDLITIRNVVGGPEYEVAIIPGFPYAFKAYSVAAVAGIQVTFLQVTN
jgi:hypothetical protein